MKEWPDPNDDTGSDLLIHIEFWGLLALTGLALLAGVGPPIVRFVRSVIG